MTLPGTRQVAGVERAHKCRAAAKRSVPVNREITGGLHPCRAHYTHEDNRPAHRLVTLVCEVLWTDRTII